MASSEHVRESPSPTREARAERLRGEEWDLDPDMRIVASPGRYDAGDYERQTQGQ